MGARVMPGGWGYLSLLCPSGSALGGCMRRVAKVDVWVDDEGMWEIRFHVDGDEKAMRTRGWRSLLTALDQVGKVIAQRLGR